MNAERGFATRIFRIVLFGLIALGITFLAGGREKIKFERCGRSLYPIQA
jgi:hypothetical protein